MPSVSAAAPRSRRYGRCRAPATAETRCCAAATSPRTVTVVSPPERMRAGFGKGRPRAPSRARWPHERARHRVPPFDASERMTASTARGPGLGCRGLQLRRLPKRSVRTSSGQRRIGRSRRIRRSARQPAHDLFRQSEAIALDDLQASSRMAASATRRPDATAPRRRRNIGDDRERRPWPDGPRGKAAALDQGNMLAYRVHRSDRAPDASSARWRDFIHRAKARCGAGRSAEPPPQISATTRSSPVRR